MTETIDVLANDTDDENEPLTIVSVTPPSVGEVVLTANSVTFHSPAGSDDRTTFTYTIEDSNGGRGQATVYVTIVGDDPPATDASSHSRRVTPPTPSPTARSDQATMIEDDPPIDYRRPRQRHQRRRRPHQRHDHHHRRTRRRNSHDRRPTAPLPTDPDANGVDTITYQLCETTGTCDTATVTVTITARNDPPQFLDAGPITVDRGQRPDRRSTAGPAASPPDHRTNPHRTSASPSPSTNRRCSPHFPRSTPPAP